MYCWALNKTILGPPKMILNVLEKKMNAISFLYENQMKRKFISCKLISCMTFSDLQYTREQFQHTLNFKKEKTLGAFCKTMVPNRTRSNNVNIFFVNKIYKSFVLIV